MIDFLDNFLNQPATDGEIFLIILKYVGIPLFSVLFILGLKILWLNWRQNKYAETLEYTLLAIDIPRENTQSPKAVENMFDQISGAHSSIGFWDKWWNGKFQAKFSFEIVSIDGYIQFLVHTQTDYRDLVEAAVYAQYPDAEITEVNDYTEEAPQYFPNEDYRLWGSEFVETDSWVYPIQTYPFFEHTLSQELKDPMNAIMETMASLRKGENIWIQYILTMTGFSWRQKCQAEIDKIVGRKTSKKSFFGLDEIIKIIENFFYEIIRQLMGEGEISEKSDNNQAELMNELPPDDLEKVEVIKAKMSKIGFLVKMRMIYWAPNNVYLPSKSVSATVGAIKQFAGLYNGFKPAAKTKTGSFLLFNDKRLAARRRMILEAYKTRSNSLGVGGEGFILNSEELATVYHFPITLEGEASIATAKQVETKKSGAPTNLPKIDEEEEAEIFTPKKKEEEILEYNFDLSKQKSKEKEEIKKTKSKHKKQGPPDNLPIA